MFKPTNWMQTHLFYIHGDEIRTVPRTDERVNSVSPMFYDSKRDCQIALKEHCELRANFYINRIRELEYQLASNE